MCKPELTVQKLAGMFDHTILKPDAPLSAFERTAAECREWGFAMMAVNSAAVPLCRGLLEGSSIREGAGEIDYVTDLTHVKNGRWDAVRREMESLTDACREGGVTCKVILETCYLTEDEIVRLCTLAREIRPDFVKTSTGFGTAGATAEHVRLMKRTVGDVVRVKAAGGIRSLDTCLAMIDAGAGRIGSSSSVKIMEEFLRREEDAR